MPVCSSLQSGFFPHRRRGVFSVHLLATPQLAVTQDTVRAVAGTQARSSGSLFWVVT